MPTKPTEPTSKEIYKQTVELIEREKIFFLFSTHLDRGIIRRCNKESLFHATGALTPTEIFNAYDLGANLVSIYPCEQMGGLSWFMFLRKIFPKVKFVPTDIMSPYEASQYLKAGAYAVAPIINLERIKEPKELIREFSVTLGREDPSGRLYK